LEFGATLIGPLARDLSFRGQGVGDLLLAEAVKVALATSEKIASLALVVDAKESRPPSHPNPVHLRKIGTSYVRPLVDALR
jgi:hypothetical protein